MRRLPPFNALRAFDAAARHLNFRLAAEELGVILVPRGTPPERLRGLREGWVHWYVGAPVVHPETRAEFGFDEGRGRIVPLVRGGSVPERPPRT